MNNVEPGWYSFRAVGLDDKNEMQVVESITEFFKNYDELKENRWEFIKKCQEYYKIKNPKITHTICKSNNLANFNWQSL